VFLLDAYDNVYVWLGHEARQDEKTMAMDAALVIIIFLSILRLNDGNVVTIRDGNIVSYDLHHFHLLCIVYSSCDVLTPAH